uniref:Uncharacterized protein n=1 Tax=Branchiostoma floridae TaxID=7739 RepID=C3ZWG3_BRAFL|eukprot:XP_002587081.1 hypothetical protein BRAFLDRAFT_102595 [Branchiostoma floridae]
MAEETPMATIQGGFPRHAPGAPPHPSEQNQEVPSCRPNRGSRLVRPDKLLGRRPVAPEEVPERRHLVPPIIPHGCRLVPPNRPRGYRLVPQNRPQRDGKIAGVYRHRLRREDVNRLPLNPMYGADLPSEPGGTGNDQRTTPNEVGGSNQPPASDGPAAGLGQGQDAAQGRAPRDGLRRGHQRVQRAQAYRNGQTFGMRLGQPLNRDARSAPPVPSTPRPGGTTDGARPVAATTHVYEDGESFEMRLWPALNRDVPYAPPVPSSPRPTGGAQQVPAGPQPGLRPQDILSQLRTNPIYDSNQLQPGQLHCDIQI